MLYDEILNNKEYLALVKQIESFKFITDEKWDWEHGLGHFKRVANYVKDILEQLNASKRIIDLGMAAALLHDVGLIKKDKVDHALLSSEIFVNYISKSAVNDLELEMLRDAIKDHSKGNAIKSLVGLALVLADKLDVTYHRTENSSIQDEINKEIQKIRKVIIKITDTKLIVNYETVNDFKIEVLKNWPKAIVIPNKAATYLNKDFQFLINGLEVNITNFLN